MQNLLYHSLQLTLGNHLIKLANFDPNDDQQAVKDTDLVGDATNAMLRNPTSNL
jgi:hypothetical protein